MPRPARKPSRSPRRESALTIVKTHVRTVIYPGSFDPLTYGHLDLIQRAVKLFDRVVVAIAQNESKPPLFTLEERRDLVEQSVQGLDRVEVDAFEGLLVDYVERRGAHAILRGLRAVSDFEFEFQLALMNRKLNERVETLFMMPKDTYTFLSSRVIKEITRLGGDVRCFLPPPVGRALLEKLGPSAGPTSTHSPHAPAPEPPAA
jgi:pantetheine-phosphate adenylyltransferase